METAFWICFLIGVIYTVVVVIFGDVLAGAFDASLEWMQLDNLPMIQPMTIMSGLTIFGGSGIVLGQFFQLTMMTVVLASLSLAVVGVVIIYFVYIRPMANAESSISYSINDLIGKEAQVVVPIPAEGYGEVMLKTVGGVVSHTAASYGKVEISGERSVVVIEVQDGVLLVSEFTLD